MNMFNEVCLVIGVIILFFVNESIIDDNDAACICYIVLVILNFIVNLGRAFIDLCGVRRQWRSSKVQQVTVVPTLRTDRIHTINTEFDSAKDASTLTMYNTSRGPEVVRLAGSRSRDIPLSLKRGVV